MNNFKVGDKVYIQNEYIEAYTVMLVDNCVIEISNSNGRCSSPASIVSKTVEECRQYVFKADVRKAMRQLNKDLAECQSTSIEEQYRKAAEAFRFAADLILSRQHLNDVK